ncbi:MAG: hypothetical protein LBT57_02600 [Puniceicoccales bacterium]|nr:hypothetical protein [Puniceicoccales bacterium]
MGRGGPLLGEVAIPALPQALSAHPLSILYARLSRHRLSAESPEIRSEPRSPLCSHGKSRDAFYWTMDATLVLLFLALIPLFGISQQPWEHRMTGGPLAVLSALRPLDKGRPVAVPPYWARRQ